MKRATKRVRYYVSGGPWANNFVLLPEETMVFSTNGFHGRYRLGRWEDV